MSKDFFKKLSDQEKEIICNKGTEDPFTGKYNLHFDAGVFVCKACESPLYESNSKFDSGCGWPSFDDEIPNAIVRYEDNSLNRKRVEICCANCGGHLGHVFHGEKITKKDTRHCVNSFSIKVVPYNNLNEIFVRYHSFWKTQEIFHNKPGIYMTQAGYIKNNDIDRSNIILDEMLENLEVLQLFFDEKIISLNEILDHVFELHEANLDSELIDSDISHDLFCFFTTKDQKVSLEQKKSMYSLSRDVNINIWILPQKKFYRADELHQNYFEKKTL